MPFKTIFSRCEYALISNVTVRNCIKLYQISEEHAAQKLKDYCLQIISSHWVGPTCADSVAASVRGHLGYVCRGEPGQPTTCVFSHVSPLR